MPAEEVRESAKVAAAAQSAALVAATVIKKTENAWVGTEDDVAAVTSSSSQSGKFRHDTHRASHLSRPFRARHTSKQSVTQRWLVEEIPHKRQVTA
jgi:fatty acid-binding protein DegV